ncbi:hypothetical protein [Ferrovibrio sp.]|uniref:hypothetical protein n=1 Tax=Ferrovibrio sp. TaxID=1917215 RepID=UPI003D097F73
MTLQSIQHRFENLVKDLFEAKGIDTKECQDERTPVDFIVNWKESRIIVDVKIYLSSVTPIQPLRRSAALLETYIRPHQAKLAILVIGNELDVSQREFLEAFPLVVTFDLIDILRFSQKHPEIFDGLESIVREAKPFSPFPTLLSLATPHTPSISKIIENKIQSLSSDERLNEEYSRRIEIKKGEVLWQNLCSIPSGKDDFSDFERAATAALKYIFEDDLTSWLSQQATHSHHSKYDLIARVSSGNDFWNLLAREFRSRYIIFEFKNYAKKIKQGQIYTTEKYLYRNALRSTAIIVSREGADEGANKAIRGALRENGKLILVVSLADIQNMLSSRDIGEDHNALLTERLDDMLIKLER